MINPATGKKCNLLSISPLPSQWAQRHDKFSIEVYRQSSKRGKKKRKKKLPLLAPPRASVPSLKPGNCKVIRLAYWSGEQRGCLAVFPRHAFYFSFGPCATGTRLGIRKNNSFVSYFVILMLRVTVIEGVMCICNGKPYSVCNLVMMMWWYDDMMMCWYDDMEILYYHITIFLYHHIIISSNYQIIILW